MAQSARQLYEIEIELEHTTPRIWRRIKVRSDTRLPKFHFMLQIVMGWENYHLHEFSNNSDRYGLPDEDFPEHSPTNESKVRVSDLIRKTGDTATYTYDFGDGWSHLITLINATAWTPSTITPVCTSGERCCPPEDVGGPHGYETYLEALGDPNHEMHNDYVEWRGPNFDSELFDVNEVNILLGREFSVGA